MYLSSSLSCTVNNVGSNCSASTNRLGKITFPSTLSNTSSHSISVSNLILSRSYEQPGLIYFKTYEKFNSI